MPKRPTPVFRGRIESGRICLERREDFAALIARLEGSDIDLRLSKHRTVRSISQNAYYWAVVIPLLAEHCGYEDEEMHTALKWRFLQKHDGPLPTVSSTASLSTVEFTDYIERVRMLAAEMGCSIPGPGQAE
jgi:hypothetical protein